MIRSLLDSSKYAHFRPRLPYKLYDFKSCCVRGNLKNFAKQKWQPLTLTLLANSASIKHKYIFFCVKKKNPVPSMLWGKWDLMTSGHARCMLGRIVNARCELTDSELPIWDWISQDGCCFNCINTIFSFSRSYWPLQMGSISCTFTTRPRPRRANAKASAVWSRITLSPRKFTWI